MLLLYICIFDDLVSVMLLYIYFLILYLLLYSYYIYNVILKPLIFRFIIKTLFSAVLGALIQMKVFNSVYCLLLLETDVVNIFCELDLLYAKSG